MLHYSTHDKNFGAVPLCWDETFTFKPSELAPFIEHVTCPDCLRMVKQAQEANP